MVQSINNSPGGIIPRTQTATLTTLNNAQQANQSIVKDKDLGNGAKPTIVQQGQKSGASTKTDTAPRGSLVDILA